MKVTLLAHLSRRLIGELLVYRGFPRPSSTFSNDFFSEVAGLILLIFHIWHLSVGGTFSSHRLIMGKEEIDNFFCLIGDILNCFYRNVY